MESADTLSIKNHSISMTNKKVPKQKSLYSVGIHPWDSQLLTSNRGTLLESTELFALSDDCIAIGESGLDKINGPDLEVQLSNFHYHIDFSEFLKKPLIIHCVKAYSELLKIHKDRKPRMPWILHDYNQNSHFFKSIKNKNIYISLGRTFFTYETSKVAKSINNIPLERILFETDEMELQVSKVYKKFAQSKNIEKYKLERAVIKNFERIFFY